MLNIRDFKHKIPNQNVVTKAELLLITSVVTKHSSRFIDKQYFDNYSALYKFNSSGKPF